MPNYCGECFYWVCSSDQDRYRRRFCPYVRRYEVSVQIASGCEGFAFSGCAILKKICEILNEPAERWFEACDAIREVLAAPEHLAWLSAYFSLSPQIADQLDRDSQRGQTANDIMREYLLPVYALWQEGKKEKAALKYQEMVAYLTDRYIK